VFDTVFQTLFTYRPVLFQEGEFRLDPPLGSPGALAVTVALLALGIAAWLGIRARGRPRDRIIVGVLRLATLALVAFCLFRPLLVVKAAVPQQNFVGVLLDDSRSMQIADSPAGARSAFLQQQFRARDAGLLKALSDRFVVRVFRFSSSLSAVSSAEDLTFTGGHSRLGAALDGARQALAGLPVAGLLVVTDGADTSEAALDESLLALQAQRVPVFTVGVGREQLPRDIEITRANTPPAVLRGTSLLIDVLVTQHGFDGQPVTLNVEDDGRIVGTEQVTLSSGDGPMTVRVRAMASDPGPRVFRFRIAPQPGELVTQNNVRESLVDVRDRRERILYFEGEPRFEMKFIRRAVTDDPNLQVVALQRTADKKYLRLDVNDAEELVSGFPKTREELFAYRGLILGSIEAAAFDGDQLRMIAEFVDRRGGGLLALGGPRALSEGGYAGTPVAETLPVVLSRPSGGSDPPSVARLKIGPTRAGSAHAVTQLGATEVASSTRWSQLPQVTTTNPIAGAKPGATVLLTGSEERRRTQIVLAAQRYGRGKALVFPIQDSWRWQMHASVAVDDQTHENYWRQLLRWLVDGVPGVVDVRTTPRVDPGEAAVVTATVVDRSFVELNDADVTARITSPDGSTLDAPMQWTGSRPGEYRTTFATKAAGAYTVDVDASHSGKRLGTASVHVSAAPGDGEYFDATMHGERLRRIAADTGGRFYTPETVGGLPEDLRYAGRGLMTVEERELWHMPIVLLALCGLVCAEWAYRRSKGWA
jgi:uncharacterized membrane protein